MVGALGLGCECTTLGIDSDLEASSSSADDTTDPGDPPTEPSTTTSASPTTTSNDEATAGFTETSSTTGSTSDETSGESTASCQFSVADQRHFVALTDEAEYAVTCESGLLSRPDVDGCTVEAAVVAEPAMTLHGGTLALNSDGSFTTTPQAGFFGCDGFTFTANDAAMMCSDAADTLLSVAPPIDGIPLDSVALTDRGFRMTGASVRLGNSVGNLGDIDRDGFDDFAASEGCVTSNGVLNGDGQRLVVFGGTKPITGDVSIHPMNKVVLGTKGFTIHGGLVATYNDHSPITGIGDFNRDGTADFAVGTGTPAQGYTHIVLGRAEFPASMTIDGVVPDGVLRLQTSKVNDGAGTVLAGVGDVNGDGLDDLMVGTSYSLAQPEMPLYAYLVFGNKELKADEQLPGMMLDIDGATAEYVVFERNKGSDYSGTLAGPGDFNGDGIDDLLISHGLDKRVFLYWGRKEWQPNPIKLADMTDSDGLLITGTINVALKGPNVTLRVTGADLNSDGYADAVIGHAAGGLEQRGTTFVVWGGEAPTENVDLDPFMANMSTRGVAIRGHVMAGEIGYSIGNAGDVDADGIDDLVLGGPGSMGHGYVLFGRAGAWGMVDLGIALMERRAVALNGEQMLGTTGYSVAGGGDFNGDGFSDMILGQPGGTAEGRVHAVFGGCFRDPTKVPLTVGGLFGRTQLVGTAAAERLIGGPEGDEIGGGGGGDVLYGGSGDDRIVVPDGEFVRVDGGGGQDTLELDGATLDLEQGVGDRVRGIEVIKLTGDSTLALGYRELRQISRTDTLTIDGPDGTAHIDLEDHDFTPVAADGYCTWTDGILNLRVQDGVTVEIEGGTSCQ